MASPEQAADTEIQQRFQTDGRSVTQIVIQSNDEVEDTVLKEHLLESLTLQQELRDNETVNSTLADEQPTVGVSNAIAIGTDPRIGFDGPPPIDSQIAVLEDRSDRMNKRVLAQLLANPSSTPEGQPPVSSLLESGYNPENETADAQRIIVVHTEAATEEEIATAQRTMEPLADETLTADTFVLGQELVFERGALATGDSFKLIGPLTLVVLFVLLLIAYRDLVDVALSAVGIALVLLWTAGLAGWFSIEFTQLLVAVPCLLVGLSLDYSLHVLMRYRETKGTGVAVEAAMMRGLAGVIVAIVATTATTATGFLTGVLSPISILRDFGVVTALGVCSALVVFGAFIPALKIQAEQMRHSEGRFSRRSIGAVRIVSVPLRYSARMGNRIPFLVIALGLLLAIGGAYGGATVDTSTDRADFLPEEPPAWMSQLPEQLRPTDYGIREKTDFVEKTFESPREPTVDILIRGNITDPSTLERIYLAEQAANDSTVSVRPADGSGTVTSPLDAIEAAAGNDGDATTVLATLEDEQRTIEVETLDSVYDEAFEADPETANATINRTRDGAYEAARLIVTIDENATGENVTSEMRTVSSVVSADTSLDAIATGRPILEYLQERAVLETVLGSLLVALIVITAILAVLFRRQYNSWTLGVLTMLPVLLSIPWLIGTMSIASIPYNAETALLTSIAVGLGTDYTIHITSRFVQERQEHPRLDALETTVAETGSVVLASAGTTAAGFAVLLLTTVPSLQRFGFVTALAVIYAAVASLTILPSLLVVWDRLRSDTVESSS